MYTEENVSSDDESAPPEEQSKQVTESSVSGSEDRLDLSATKQLILRAVLDLGATKPKNKLSSAAIGTKAKLHPDARLRIELAALRDLKLLGGEKGSRGYWLTQAGVRESRR